MDENSLSHTRWKCQYHIVFIPKYRRKVLYGKVKADIDRLPDIRWGLRFFKKHISNSHVLTVPCVWFIIYSHECFYVHMDLRRYT